KTGGGPASGWHSPGQQTVTVGIPYSFMFFCDVFGTIPLTSSFTMRVGGGEHMARRSRPFVLLALAVLSGGAAAYLALQYIRQQATPLLAATPKNSQVVVAAHAMPLGAVLGERDVKTVEWAGGALPPGFIGSPAEAVGRGLIVP